MQTESLPIDRVPGAHVLTSSSSNGLNDGNSPSPNGSNGGESPSPNGLNGADPPSPNGSNGRDARGRFVKGNPGGPGNPHGRRTARLRALFLKSISDDDFQSVVACLVKYATRLQNVSYIREVLDRTIGKATTAGTVVEDDSPCQPDDEAVAEKALPSK